MGLHQDMGSRIQDRRTSSAPSSTSSMAPAQSNRTASLSPGVRTELPCSQAIPTTSCVSGPLACPWLPSKRGSLAFLSGVFCCKEKLNPEKKKEKNCENSKKIKKNTSVFKV